MKPQVEKPSAPEDATLQASAEPNNTHIKRIEVYDDHGLAFIIKQFPTGKWISWHCVDRTADWFIANNSPRCGWTIA